MREYYRANREQRLAYARQYKRDHPEKVREWSLVGRSRPGNAERVRQYQTERTRAFSAWFRPSLGQLRCEYCGKAFDDSSGKSNLSFHHRDPSTKRFEISSGSRYRREDVLAEISKCDIICQSCHVRLHRPRLGTGTT